MQYVGEGGGRLGPGYKPRYVCFLCAYHVDIQDFSKFKFQNRFIASHQTQ